MRQIPRSMMTDTIQYYEANNGGRYEGHSQNPVTIKNVLIYHMKGVTKSNPGNQEPMVVGKLFLDKVSTSPFQELKYGSKIVNDDGDTFYVKDSKLVKVFGMPHHYEVDLM